MQVPDLPRERPPVLLPREHPVQLPLTALRQVGTLPVEEHDVHGVRHSRRGPDHDPAGATARGLLPRHGQRYVLQVPYVDGARLKSGDDRALQRPSTTGVVTGRGDGRTLLESGRIGAGQPHGQLGRDLHVQDSRDPSGAEELRLAPGLPDHRGVDECTGLDDLERVDPHIALNDRFFPDQALVADDGAVLDPGRAHDVGVLADDTATEIAVLPDIHVVVHDGPVQKGPALHDDVGADDGVLPDFDTGLDLGVVPDVEGTAKDGIGMHFGTFRHPYARRDLEPVELDVDLALQDVGLRLHIALVGADILPVALRDIPIDRLALLHQLREDITGPVDGHISLDILEDLGLHDVNTGVHGVGENLAPGRLLKETLDLALFVDDGDSEFQGIRHPRQTDGDEGTLLLVETDQIAEVEVGQGIAGDHKEGIVLQRLFGVLDASGGTEWLLLVGIAELHSELLAVTEVVLDQRSQELDSNDGLVEPMPFEQPKNVLHDRPVGHRQERLGHA